MTTLREVTAYLDSFAPLAYQESYDNSGLIAGDLQMAVKGILVCLDSTEDVVEEAVANGCNLIVAHHPIVFNGLKRFTGSNYVERTLIKALKHDVAIYAAHTNLDNIAAGVNSRIAQKLSLSDCRILHPKPELLSKLVTFCPLAQADAVRQALCEAGAGVIGNYDQCSFSLEGAGTFRAGTGSTPFVGKPGELHREKECRIEVIFPAYLEATLIKALIEAHPYEEAAYDIYPLKNSHPLVGSGMIGSLARDYSPDGFLAHLKHAMKLTCIRYTPLPADKPIRKVAVCGGSGSFLLKQAITQGADAFVSADFRYHQFFDAENKLMIADIGHFESERFTSELIYELLVKKFVTFAVRVSAVNTNPVSYYC